MSLTSRCGAGAGRLQSPLAPHLLRVYARPFGRHYAQGSLPPTPICSFPFHRFSFPGPTVVWKYKLAPATGLTCPLSSTQCTHVPRQSARAEPDRDLRLHLLLCEWWLQV